MNALSLAVLLLLPLPALAEQTIEVRVTEEREDEGPQKFVLKQKLTEGSQAISAGSQGNLVAASNAGGRKSVFIFNAVIGAPTGAGQFPVQYQIEAAGAQSQGEAALGPGQQKLVTQGPSGANVSIRLDPASK